MLLGRILFWHIIITIWCKETILAILFSLLAIPGLTNNQAIMVVVGELWPGIMDLLYLICMGAISVEVLERLGMWVYSDIMIHLVAEVPQITFNLLSFTGTIIFIIHHHHHHHHLCKEQEDISTLK